MLKIEFIGHQGDVCLFEIDDFPKGDRAQDDLTKKHQLALGELSGHNHYFSETEAVDLFKINSPEFNGLTFIDVKKDTPLIHGLIKGYRGKEADQDYHSEIVIGKGRYISGIVEETDWISKTVRRVID